MGVKAADKSLNKLGEASDAVTNRSKKAMFSPYGNIRSRLTIFERNKIWNMKKNPGWRQLTPAERFKKYGVTAQMLSQSEDKGSIIAGKTKNYYTEHEIQNQSALGMTVTSVADLDKIECDPFFKIDQNINPYNSRLGKEKTKIKNTFIRQPNGIERFMAKDLKCLKKFYDEEKRMRESKKHYGNQKLIEADREDGGPLKKITMNRSSLKQFRPGKIIGQFGQATNHRLKMYFYRNRMSDICQKKMDLICKLHGNNSDYLQYINKTPSDERSRDMLKALKLNEDQIFTRKLAGDTQSAAEICNEMKFCMDYVPRISDIPRDTTTFFNFVKKNLFSSDFASKEKLDKARDELEALKKSKTEDQEKTKAEREQKQQAKQQVKQERKEQKQVNKQTKKKEKTDRKEFIKTKQAEPTKKEKNAAKKAAKGSQETQDLRAKQKNLEGKTSTESKENVEKKPDQQAPTNTPTAKQPTKNEAKAERNLLKTVAKSEAKAEQTSKKTLIKSLKKERSKEKSGTLGLKFKSKFALRKKNRLQANEQLQTKMTGIKQANQKIKDQIQINQINKINKIQKSFNLSKVRNKDKKQQEDRQAKIKEELKKMNGMSLEEKGKAIKKLKSASSFAKRDYKKSARKQWRKDKFAQASKSISDAHTRSKDRGERRIKGIKTMKNDLVSGETRKRFVKRSKERGERRWKAIKNTKENMGKTIKNRWERRSKAKAWLNTPAEPKIQSVEAVAAPVAAPVAVAAPKAPVAPVAAPVAAPVVAPVAHLKQNQLSLR